MDDKEVFELIDEEYGLSEKQEALNKIVEEMMAQLEKLKKREEEMASELEALKKENNALRNVINKKSK